MNKRYDTTVYLDTESSLLLTKISRHKQIQRPKVIVMRMLIQAEAKRLNIK